MPIWKSKKFVGIISLVAWIERESFPFGIVALYYLLVYFTLNNDGSRTRAVLPLYYTPIIFWLPVPGCTKAGMCDIRRIARIIGALPRETAGSFQEVPLQLKNNSMGV